MKSKEFVYNRIKEGHCNGMNIENYENMHEQDFLSFIKNSYKEMNDYWKETSFTLTCNGTTTEDIKGETEVTLEYNPEADFEYFTMESCTCDGTYTFLDDLMQRIFAKVMCIGTYNVNTVPKDFKTNPWKYNFKYIFGNYVINEEYGDFGTEKKPWLHSRFTVMLPIKCEYIEKENLN